MDNKKYKDNTIVFRLWLMSLVILMVVCIGVIINTVSGRGLLDGTFFETNDKNVEFDKQVNNNESDDKVHLLMVVSGLFGVALGVLIFIRVILNITEK